MTYGDITGFDDAEVVDEEEQEEDSTHTDTLPSGYSMSDAFYMAK